MFFISVYSLICERESFQELVDEDDDARFAIFD